MMVPKNKHLVSNLKNHVGWRRRTGPTRSGMNIETKTTLIKMKKKPSRVTKFGAIHSGSSFTQVFHYHL